MKKEFEVSFKKNDVCQARIVRAKAADLAERYFREIEPKATVYGVSEYSGMIKPGMPVEEVPDDFTGIVLEDVWDRQVDGIRSTRTLYFDVPLSYLGPEYFRDLDDIPVSACISVEIDPEYPTYEESGFEVSPTNEEGSDFDWYHYDMTADEFAMFMSIAEEFFRDTINVGVRYSENGREITTEFQFDLDDNDGEFDTAELFNCIFDVIKGYENPVVLYIEEETR